jgi:hypothetical protein
VQDTEKQQPAPSTASTSGASTASQAVAGWGASGSDVSGFPPGELVEQSQLQRYVATILSCLRSHSDQIRIESRSLPLPSAIFNPSTHNTPSDLHSTVAQGQRRGGREKFQCTKCGKWYKFESSRWRHCRNTHHVTERSVLYRAHDLRLS